MYGPPWGVLYFHCYLQCAALEKTRFFRVGAFCAIPIYFFGYFPTVFPPMWPKWPIPPPRGKPPGPGAPGARSPVRARPPGRTPRIPRVQTPKPLGLAPGYAPAPCLASPLRVMCRRSAATSSGGWLCPSLGREAALARSVTPRRLLRAYELRTPFTAWHPRSVGRCYPAATHRPERWWPVRPIRDKRCNVRMFRPGPCHLPDSRASRCGSESGSRFVGTLGRVAALANRPRILPVGGTSPPSDGPSGLLGRVAAASG